MTQAHAARCLDQPASFHWRAFRKAHHSSIAKTAYSVRCAPLRTTRTTRHNASSEISGTSQRTTGSMIREERWTDFLSPEAEKITKAQSTAGSQDLASDFNFDTGHRKP